jgi:hydrogenase expression/formation protein HypE
MSDWTAVTEDVPVEIGCPIPRLETERVLLGHGSGGQLMAELLADVIAPALGDGEPLEDAAVVDVGGAGGVEVLFSTDSFVVTPRFFPGGDIGSLAVHGTVNDLAMRGAQPVALSLAYIVEEGLPFEELRRITASVAAAAKAVGVRVVTGDTKVVERGGADGIYLNTTGIGVRSPGPNPSATGGRPGDVVLLSGPIGLHGTAILSAREGLGFEADIASDSRPLHRLVAQMIEAGGCGVHALRDPTRGGLATALNELAASGGVSIELVEAAIPIPAVVAAACDLLGLDPMQVANEGCLVALIAPDLAEAVLAAARACPEGSQAQVIGRVGNGEPGLVTAETLVGSRRIVGTLIGEQLPRIC